METQNYRDHNTATEEQQVISRIEELAEARFEEFRAGEIPSLEVPTSSTSNIEFDPENGVWVHGDSTTERNANSVRGAKKLVKSAYLLRLIKQQLEEGRSSTLREIYYISESFDLDEAQFDSQDESNNLIEDIERKLGLTREDMHIRPEESGATIIGPLEIEEETRRGERDIHCQRDVGEGGYQIPSNPETVTFTDHDADFVLCVETGGMRDRLVENGFDEKYNAIIVHLKGQPSRSTRRVTKRLNGELDLPVLVFTDADPWSYRIFASVAFGSAKSAHLSEYLATPDARYIGVRPTDIKQYDLPTDKLKDSDINALESELENDPRFDTEFWQREIQTQLDIGEKAEQQALAKHGLDFVTNQYLPERLEEMEVI